MNIEYYTEYLCEDEKKVLDLLIKGMAGDISAFEKVAESDYLVNEYNFLDMKEDGLITEEAMKAVMLCAIKSYITDDDIRILPYSEDGKIVIKYVSKNGFGIINIDENEYGSYFIIDTDDIYAEEWINIKQKLLSKELSINDLPKCALRNFYEDENKLWHGTFQWWHGTIDDFFGNITELPDKLPNPIVCYLDKNHGKYYGSITDCKNDFVNKYCNKYKKWECASSEEIDQWLLFYDESSRSIEDCYTLHCVSQKAYRD